MAACVELIIGPMFAGKTTELLRRARALAAIGQRVVFVAHASDALRYQSPELSSAIDAAVRTHARDEQRGANVHYASRLADVDHLVAHADVVAVDEVQFFSDLESFVLRHESRRGLTILLSGLDGDAERRAFGQTLSIIPLCDDVVKLRAFDSVKRDGSRASFSMRLTEHAGASCVRVGGSDLYAAVGRDTYLRNLQNLNSALTASSSPSSSHGAVAASATEIDSACALQSA